MKRTIANLLTWLLFIVCVAGLVKMGPETQAAARGEVEFTEHSEPDWSAPVWGEIEGQEDLIWVSFGGDSPAVFVEKAEAAMLSKLVWGEARGVDSKAEQAAVIWCALNRLDSVGYARGRSIEYVVTYPMQFTGYRKSNPVTEECFDLAVDVLARWNLEKLGYEETGRVLPMEYTFFRGDGVRNHFRDAYRGGTRWDWSLESPYREAM